MTTWEIRIASAIANIEKINKRIERFDKTIAKKTLLLSTTTEKNELYYLNCDIDYAKEDKKRAERDLVDEKKKFEEYRAKRALEIKKEEATPIVPAVEEFLTHWKEEAKKFYIAEVGAVDDFKKTVSELKWSERNKAMMNRFGGMVLNLYGGYHSPAELENKLEVLLTGEVKARREDLFARCSAVAGVILDASGLHIGNNGSINGVVIGENGKARVETIMAGGYNIQILHYRVLVSPIGRDTYRQSEDVER